MEGGNNNSGTATAPKIESGNTIEPSIKIDSAREKPGIRIIQRLKTIIPFNTNKRVESGAKSMETLARPDLKTLIPPEIGASTPGETAGNNMPHPPEVLPASPALDEQGHMDTSGDHTFLAEANQQSITEQLATPPTVLESSPSLAQTPTTPETVTPVSVLNTIQDEGIPHPVTTTASGDVMRQVMSAVKPAPGILQRPQTEPPASGTLAPTSRTTSEYLTNPADIAAVQAVAEKNQQMRQETPAEVLPPVTPADPTTDTPLRSPAEQQAAFLAAEQANAADWNNKVAENIAKTPIQPAEIIPPVQPEMPTPPPVVEPEPLDAAFQVNSVTTSNVDPAKDPRFGAGTLSTADYAEAMRKQMDPAEQLRNRLKIDLTKKSPEPAVQPLQPDQVTFTSKVMGEDPAPQLETASASPVAETAAQETPLAAVEPSAEKPVEQVVIKPSSPEGAIAADPEFTPQLEAAAERAKQRITALEAEMAKQRSFLDRLQNKPATLSQAERQAIHDEEQQLTYAEIAKAPNAPELAQEFPRVAEAITRVAETPVPPQSEIRTLEDEQEAADTETLVDVLVNRTMSPEQADELIKGLAPEVVTTMKGKNPDIDAAIQRMTEQPDASTQSQEAQLDSVDTTPIETIMETAPTGLTPEERAELNAVITKVKQEVQGIKTSLDLKQKADSELDPVKKNRLRWLVTFIKTFSKLSLFAANGGILVPTDPSNSSSTVDMMMKASKAIADGGKIVQVNSDTPAPEPAS